VRHRIFISSVQREFTEERKALKSYIEKAGSGIVDMFDLCASAGLVEMTIPDKPRSSKQNYRITDKGRAVLENLGD
jgi:predicted HTH transcriptional regulator